MHTVHHESHYVGTWHARQLLSDDVLQVDQVAHIFQCPACRLKLANTSDVYLLIVPHNLELD